jgi:voltage-gated potassium channel
VVIDFENNKYNCWLVFFVSAILSTVMSKVISEIYRWLGVLNDLLLIPMFAIIVMEINNDGNEALFDAALNHKLEMQDLTLNAFFFAEWFLGLLIAPKRKEYLFSVTKILDFISCLPFGLTQWVRIARISRVLKVIRVVTRAKRYHGPGAELLQVASLVCATIFAGAYSISLMEKENFGDFSDALWWSLVTVSTVGYGDYYPKTMEGRMVAAPLIAVGVGVCGYVAGFMTRLMSSDNNEDEKFVMSEHNSHLKEIAEQLKVLNEAQQRTQQKCEELELILQNKK